MPPTFPLTFNGLAWSSLAAQSAEQLSLAETPIIAVIRLGAGPGISFSGLAEAPVRVR